MAGIYSKLELHEKFYKSKICSNASLKLPVGLTVWQLLVTVPLQELPHILVDQLRSILLYPVTTVGDVPVGGREWCKLCKCTSILSLSLSLSLSDLTVRLVTKLE